MSNLASQSWEFLDCEATSLMKSSFMFSCKKGVYQYHGQHSCKICNIKFSASSQCAGASRSHHLLFFRLLNKKGKKNFSITPLLQFSQYKGHKNFLISPLLLNSHYKGQNNFPILPPLLPTCPGWLLSVAALPWLNKLKSQNWKGIDAWLKKFEFREILKGMDACVEDWLES